MPNNDCKESADLVAPVEDANLQYITQYFRKFMKYYKGNYNDKFYENLEKLISHATSRNNAEVLINALNKINKRYQGPAGNIAGQALAQYHAAEKEKI